MKTAKVSTPTVGIRKPSALKAAKKGAVVSAIAYTATSAVTWALQPKNMQRTVKEYGGFKNYAKGFALGVAVVAFIGGLFNGALGIITNKINDNKTPKAN